MKNLRLQVFTFFVTIFTLFFAKGQSGFPIDNEASYSAMSNFQIDTNLPLYAIPSEVNVANGVVSYMVPVDLPKGVNGLTPQLSFVYSSSSSNGVMGWGWNLAAVSQISRTQESFVFDDNKNNPDINNNNVLAIDGQRLLLYSGAALLAGAQYRTGTESFQKIIKLTEGFEVWQKNGVKRYFGTSSSSRISNGGGQTLNWLLDKIEDRNGNQIVYSYVIDQSSGGIRYRLDKIDYIMNDGVGKGVVEFHYRDRYDPVVSYLGRYKYVNDLLLKKVVSKYEGTEYSRYELNYWWWSNTSARGDDFSRLLEIQNFIGGQQVNPTLIKWDIDHTSNSMPDGVIPYSSIDRGPAGSYLPMDINGDGINDILTLEHTKIDLGECWSGLTKYDMHRHNFSIHAYVSGVRNPDPVKNTFVSEFKPRECRREPFARIHPGDFNGDGLADFLLQRVEADDVNRYYVEIYLNDINSPGNFNLKYSRRVQDHLPPMWNSDNLPYKPEDYIGGDDGDPDQGYILGANFKGKQEPRNVPFELVVGDFDGNGTSDYAYMGAFFASSTDDHSALYTQALRIYYSEPMSSTSAGNLTVSSFKFKRSQDFFGWPQTHSLTVGDFNGDGKSDILRLDPIANSNVVACWDQSTWMEYGGPLLMGSQHFIGIGDFNGDGLSDVFHSNHFDHYYPTCHYSNGSGFDLSYVTGGEGYASGEYSEVLIGDFDDDRRTDIMVVKPNFDEYYVHYNKVNGWVDLGPEFINAPFSGQNVPKGSFTVGNFSDEGMLVLYDPQVQSNGGVKTFGIRGLKKARYPEFIQDGLKKRIEFEFTELMVSSEFVRDYFEYPNISISGSMMVVTGLRQRDFKRNVISKVTYDYNSPRFNLEGLGFLGYNIVRSYDSIQNIRQIDRYGFVSSAAGEISNPFVLKSTTVKLNLSGDFVSKRELTYDATYQSQVLSSGKKQFYQPRLLFEKNTNYVENSGVRKAMTWDNYGNILSAYCTYYNNQGMVGNYAEQTYTSSTYTDDGSWIDWLPVNVGITMTRYGEDPVVENSSFEYYSNGNLWKKKVRTASEYEVEEEYVYTGEGNIQSKTIKPTNMSDRVKSYVWSADKRYLVSEQIDVSGVSWVKTNTYDYSRGLLESSTDVNGLVTRYYYDNIDRIDRTVYPDLNEIQTQRIWDWEASYGNSSQNSEALFYIRTIGTNQPPKQEWFDGRMRSILVRNKNQSDQWVNVETVFDNRGNVEKRSMPYFDGGNIDYITYDYDDYGRVISQVSPSTSISTEYNSRIVEVTDNNSGMVKTIAKDATGKVITSTDDGGMISFSYNSWGKPYSIVTPGKTVNLEYDDYGFQIGLNDPGPGLMRYEYDAMGNVTLQEDANGVVFTFTYDEMDRILSKEGPDGVYDYHYDSQLLGALDEVTSPYNTSVRYGYDLLGRKRRLTEEVEGKEYEFNYSYTSEGNLKTMQYPNGLVLEYDYPKYGVDDICYGFVGSIKRMSDQQLIWEYSSENVFGQVTEYSLGQTTMNHSFDPETGFPNVFANDANFNQEYIFEDFSGNLLSRHNQSTGLSEYFAYDDLDRLARETGSGGTNIETTYDGNGSILFKTDAGDYINLNNGQTTEIENNPGTISDDEQVLTYMPFNSVRTINEGVYNAEFIYGPDEQRMKMVIYKSGSVENERIYINNGLYEVDYYNGSWRELAYVLTPTGMEAVYIGPEGPNNEDLHLLNLDHLGSILQVTADDGTVVEEYAYDGWGNRMNPQSGSINYTPGQSSSTFAGILSRGFTGHEHLDCFGLINMNGRLYDPLLGRMLSADNFVVSEYSSQSYNRYSYVSNNPLKYIDPDGEVAGLAYNLGYLVLQGAVLGGVFNVGLNQNNIDGGLEAVGYFASGAVAGAAGAAIGAGGSEALGTYGFMQGALVGGGSGFAAGFLQSTGNALMEGANLANAASIGFKSGAQGALTGGAVLGAKFMLSAWNKGLHPIHGRLRVDLTQGIGAHNIPNESWGDKIWGKYEGEFHGVDIYESSELGVGYKSGGVTIPGRGIIVGKYAYSRRADMWLVKHEYGHILQARDYGKIKFYARIAPMSLGSAANKTVVQHSKFWTEVNANLHSYEYFNRPINWPTGRFPLTYENYDWKPYLEQPLLFR